MKTDKVDMREKTNDFKELYTLHFPGFGKCRVYLSHIIPYRSGQTAFAQIQYYSQGSF